MVRIVKSDIKNLSQKGHNIWRLLYGFFSKFYKIL